MLKLTRTYTDYNGETRTEDFHFNLNKAEIIEMDMTSDGGLQAYIKKIIAEKDSKKIMELWKKIILGSYGVKTADGRFEKSEEISTKFSQSVAYDDLMFDLITDENEASKFINGIVPSVPNK